MHNKISKSNSLKLNSKYLLLSDANARPLVCIFLIHILTNALYICTTSHYEFWEICKNFFFVLSILKVQQLDQFISRPLSLTISVNWSTDFESRSKTFLPNVFNAKCTTISATFHAKICSIISAIIRQDQFISIYPLSLTIYFRQLIHWYLTKKSKTCSPLFTLVFNYLWNA